MLESIAHRLHSYYQGRAEESKTRAQQVGWKSTHAQRVRFEQLARVLPASKFSVNDFGCGLGDLLGYLREAGYRDFTYQGYDMLEAMVEQAGNQHATDQQSSFLTVQDAAEMRVADFTVASGVFNIRFEMADAEWRDYICYCLTRFNEKSRRGFAFNALTSYSDPERRSPELYYAEPAMLFDFCKRNFSKDVALLHDYQEYDFTILVRKH